MQGGTAPIVVSRKISQTDITTSSSTSMETASMHVNDDETVEDEYPGDIDCIPNENTEDGLLRTVLEELDSERAKRIQLEKQLSERPKRKEDQPSPQSQNDQLHRKEIDEQEQDLFESQNHSLYIAHQINSIFAERHSIQKRNLSLVLSTLFTKLFHNTVVEVCGLKHDPIDEKSREKRIKEAIHRVVVESDGTIGKRLLRTEYNESMLIPLLLEVSTDFVKSLLRDLNNPPQISSSKSSQSKANVMATSSSVSAISSSCHTKELKEMQLRHSNEIKKIKIERDGYLDLVGALTTGVDAITLAANNAEGTLPLHIVRFLEIMPWDDRVQDYISVEEEVVQWQAFDTRTGFWSDKRMKSLPQFRYLPINNMDDTEIPFSPVGKIQQAIDSFGSNASFVTDRAYSQILDLSHGFPLPTKGEWEWISNWRIESSSLKTSSSNGDESWEYSDEIKDLLAKDNGSDLTSHVPRTTSRFRKRIWKRCRVLTSYPGISQRTRQMLKMNSHNSKLTLALSKLHDQVNDMQNKLTRQEEVHEKEISDLNAEKAILGDEVERKKNAIVALFKEKNELQASNTKLQTKVKQTIKKSTIDPEKIQQNEAKEVEKPLKEESILNHSMSPKSTPEKIPKPLITLEDVKKENNRSVDEAVPKKDSAPLTIESSPKEKVATQDLKKSYFQKSTNQSNSPPSLSFLFKSSSSQDEQHKNKVANNEGPKHTKTLEPKASSSSFSFLFSSNDTTN